MNNVVETNPDIERLCNIVGRNRAETQMQIREEHPVTFDFPKEHAFRLYMSGFSEPLKHEEVTESIDEINDQIGFDPDNGDLCYLRAVCYLNQQQYTEAEQDFRFAVDLETQYYFKALSQLIIFSIVKCNFTQAQIYVNQGLKKEPDNKYYLYYNAQIQFESDKQEEGIKLINDLISKYPDFPDAYLQLSQYYFLKDDLKPCQEVYFILYRILKKL